MKIPNRELNHVCRRPSFGQFTSHLSPDANMLLLEIDVILLEAVALANTSPSWLSPGVAFRVVSMPLTLHGRPGVSGRGIALRGAAFGVEGPTWDSPQRHKKHTPSFCQKRLFPANMRL